MPVVCTYLKNEPHHENVESVGKGEFAKSKNVDLEGSPQGENFEKSVQFVENPILSNSPQGLNLEGSYHQGLYLEGSYHQGLYLEGSHHAKQSAQEAKKWEIHAEKVKAPPMAPGAAGPMPAAAGPLPVGAGGAGATAVAAAPAADPCMAESQPLRPKEPDTHTSDQAPTMPPREPATEPTTTPTTTTTASTSASPAPNPSASPRTWS